MRISTRVVIDLVSNEVIERQSFEYLGPIAECISFGGSQSKQKSKSKSSSESGTRYNEEFLSRALDFAGGKPNQARENFDAAAYLKAHPDVAADPNYGSDPYQHWLDFGRNDPTFEFTSKFTPTYAPEYKTSTYTPGSYTAVAPEGYGRLESNLYESQASKLRNAYDQAVARQREELAQSGALNSPSQYLEGSARSAMDRAFLENQQQAARDAALARLGLEEREAGRRTAYDVGEAARQTEYGTSEAARQTAFNEQTAARLLELWLKKLGLAIESGRYSTATGEGSSTGSTMGGNFGLFQFGGSSSD